MCQPQSCKVSSSFSTEFQKYNTTFNWVSYSRFKICLTLNANIVRRQYLPRFMQPWQSNKLWETTRAVAISAVTIKTNLSVQLNREDATLLNAQVCTWLAVPQCNPSSLIFMYRISSIRLRNCSLVRWNWLEMSSTTCLRRISTYERSDMAHLISCLQTAIFLVVSLVHWVTVELLEQNQSSWWHSWDVKALTKDPNPSCPRKSSCRFDSRAAPGSADRFATTTPCWRGLDRADKSTHGAFESVRWFQHAAAREPTWRWESFHALYANAFPHHRRRCLQMSDKIADETLCRSRYVPMPVRFSRRMMHLSQMTRASLFMDSMAQRMRFLVSWNKKQIDTSTTVLTTGTKNS